MANKDFAQGIAFRYFVHIFAPNYISAELLTIANK